MFGTFTVAVLKLYRFADAPNVTVFNDVWNNTICSKMWIYFSYKQVKHDVHVFTTTRISSVHSAVLVHNCKLDLPPQQGKLAIVCSLLYLNRQHPFQYVVLSCQSRVTVTSCFVYKVIMDLYSIDHLCINTIHRIGLIHK